MSGVADPGGSDAILFEILRHRLVAINDEAATTIARISGSPVANESYDFNTALMDDAGNVIVIGAYVMAHACALDRVVRYVIDNHTDNPGIGDGDMYVTNDPYVGAMHQPDVVVVAPIFLDGERIMWCGSVVHQPDVGGPLAGSVTTGARSIYQEAIPMPPVRLVEGGTIRKDLEREYLIRSRLPELNALDLRGQIAANRVQASRIVELCHRYGRDRVLAAVDNLLDSAERRFRDRLRDLPDGRWRAVSLVEHDGVQDAVYPVSLTMDKRADALTLDFTDSADQAPALVNCGKGTLYGYTMAALLTLLAYDLPWSPAALLRAVTICSREGSVVDARWPAGVSMGNTAVGHAIRTAVNICVDNMLDGAVSYERQVMASCMGSFAGQNISGVRDDGSRFGTMLLDSLAGGGGARSFADGVDTAGVINSPKAAIGNVEVNEHNYPLLYLWRRQLPRLRWRRTLPRGCRRRARIRPPRRRADGIHPVRPWRRAADRTRHRRRRSRLAARASRSSVAAATSGRDRSRTSPASFTCSRRRARSPSGRPTSTCIATPEAAVSATRSSGPLTRSPPTSAPGSCQPGPRRRITSSCSMPRVASSRARPSGRARPSVAAGSVVSTRPSETDPAEGTEPAEGTNRPKEPARPSPSLRGGACPGTSASQAIRSCAPIASPRSDRSGRDSRRPCASTRSR